MMASWVSGASCSNRCSSLSVVMSSAPVSTRCRGEMNGLKFLAGKKHEFYAAGKVSSLRSYVTRQKMKSSLATGQKKSSSRNQRGKWEEPDDGSGSDYDEKDDMEDNDLDFESDWEGDTDAATGVNYEEELRKEVENMLEPEERATLEQNALPDLNKLSTGKWSALHTLGLSGQIPFMDQLLENGTDIDMVDKDGLTALHMAVIGKKEAIISHLLRKGTSPHVKDKHGATPLHYAVQVGALQTVKILIKYKVDVNVTDLDGWTPLHISMQTRNRDIAKVLLVNGADRTRKNKDGKTPLDLSLCYGKDFKAYDLAKLLKLVPANREY
uniref:Ankyrin repeat domain-containing protein EMB506, chloroplastic n=1 Tax=Kalanchoe fedtschenkoi TaxID=63787 RepID=A0A7N0ZY39_KALFE